MKDRVDGMEGSMQALEDNFAYISRASDSVSSSFSARRAELERLNAVKRNLTKLQVRAHENSTLAARDSEPT